MKGKNILLLFSLALMLSAPGSSPRNRRRRRAGKGRLPLHAKRKRTGKTAFTVSEWCMRISAPLS